MEPARSKFNTAAYQQACEWFVEFRADEPDEQTRKAFHAWLKEAPAHMGAYLEIAALWNESSGLRTRDKWPIDTLLAQAQGDGANVVQLPESVGDQHFISARNGRRIDMRRWSIAASIAAFAVAAGALVWFQYLSVPTYVTDIGEQRSISLPDGSTVHLDARSKIRIRYSDRERAIDLLQGQALFSVTGDSARPFVVLSDAARVRAIGTQFDINRTRGRMTITVLEGRVAVQPGRIKEESAAHMLSAGEQAVVTGAAVERSACPDPALAMAWIDRQLVFASTPLVAAVEIFNRYNERQLTVRDPALESFRIDGVFSSTNPAALIQFLRERSGVRIVETRNEIFITRQ